MVPMDDGGAPRLFIIWATAYMGLCWLAGKVAPRECGLVVAGVGTVSGVLQFASLLILWDSTCYATLAWYYAMGATAALGASVPLFIAAMCRFWSTGIMLLANLCVVVWGQMALNSTIVCDDATLTIVYSCVILSAMELMCLVWAVIVLSSGAAHPSHPALADAV